MKSTRLNRVLEGMDKLGLSQALVTSTESIYYLTGLWIAPGEGCWRFSYAPAAARCLSTACSPQRRRRA